ncbi:unnamed protein product [Owenia fusiformis]|uniref:Uncharacterized protein n=1 Tax=Owenia fusiformis TaxID=6347 RepID=A0A8J1XW20_OWEFU|nr:unnamed protein product [Owenia fusiformis]
MECNHSNEDSNGDQVVPSMKEDFAHNELLPPHIYDNKKRPLSISSTSSSSSSTSSLPRQLRKKLASHVEVSGSLEGGVRPLGAYIRHGVQDFPMDTLTDEEHCSELNDSELTTDQSTLSVTTPEKVDLKDGLVSSKRKGSIHSLLNEPVDANKLYIERVVEEILFTERTYVRDLLEIIEGYYAYILDTPELDITQEDICSLFSNIEDIYRFNSTFLEGLERCGNDPVRIAECFVSQNEGFPIYTHYCTNYPDAVAILTKYMQVRSTAEVFKQRQMALKHGLPLGSYLLKPVQRILKYHLLLQNIVKRYDQDAPGYDTLVEALASMTCVSQHINEMKRKHEHAVHVQEIQSMLYGWEGEDLTTYGELLLEDTFRMCGAKAFRHVFLFEKTLLITKKREEGMLSCKAAILCSNLMLVESIPKEPLSFHIIPFDSPKSQYTLQAKSLEQKRRWCQEVKKAILESFKSKIPEKARELVMTLGHSKDEEAELENKDPSRKQHHAPEYLEKRKSRRKSEFSLLKSQRSSPRGKKGFTRKLSVPNFASKYSPKNSPSTARKQNSKENSPVSEDTLKEEEENAQTEVREPGLIERRSRSMESICDSKDSGQGSGESSHRQSLYDSADAGCYDDACPRAHRISQLLNNEGLERQLSSKDSLVSWDKELVSSVLNVPNIKRAESYKMAAKLNRVDSKIIRAQIQKRLSSTDNAQTETEMEIDDDLYEIVTVKRLDDGYVNIEYKNEGSENEESPYANVILRQSKTNLLYDDNEKDYIVVHTDNLKSSPNSTPSNNEKTPKSENSTAKHSTPNSAINDEGIYDNIHRPYDNIHFNMSYEEPALSNSRPLISPIDMKALDEVFKPLQSPPGTLKAVTKPVAFRPDSPDKVLHLTRSMSSGDTDDPWIPRESNNIPRSRSDNTEFDRLEKYFLETSLSAKPRRHSRARHHRQVSDTTEMFSNNSGLLSPKPGRRDFRYCTPPRTLEADFKAAMSGDKKCEQNIMQRYGTPPREIPEPGRLPHSVSVEPACSVDNPKKLPSRSKSFPSRPRRSQSETAMWKDIEDYSLSATEHSNPLPKFPVSNDKPTRPSSMYSPVSSNSTSPQASNTSPSHSASSESIVGSFKTAMAQLTSKLKGRRPLSPHAISTASSSLESSPSHNIHTPESIEEEGEFTEGSTQSSPKKYYVYKLARQYSKKLRSEVKMIEKRINGHGGNSNGASGGKFKKDKQLLSLLKDPGSVSIGARMAETKPIVLGTTYSLPRQRPPRPRKDIKSPDVEANKSDTSSHEGTPERHFEHKIDDDNALLAAYGLADNSASDSMGNESDASFYEKQLTDVLERSVDTTPNGGISHDQNTPIKSNATNENVSHDSAVYSDNDTDHQDSLIKSTIKDTVKNIEEKYRNRPIRKSDTHKRARTPGIEEKLQALKEHVEGNITKTDIDDLPQTTSVRDRKIELIRNYQIGDSVNRVDRYRSRTPSSGTGTPGSPYFDMSGSQSEDDALRSVHVRDVIHKFQNETSESES